METERNKRLDAAWTRKNSEADLSKAREDLKEITRARDNAELGLVSAQKQVDLKKKLVKAEEAKNVAE